VLLKSEMGKWTTVDWGYGFRAEDWLSAGAPQPLADFLAGNAD